MKKRGMALFLIVLMVLIIAVIVWDYISGRPGKSESNPFAYDIESYKSVDPALINYKETKNYKIGFQSPSAVFIFNDEIYVTGDEKLKVISLSGEIINEILLEFKPVGIHVTSDRIFLAGTNQVVVYDKQGTLLSEWPALEPESHITAIAVADEKVFIADAAKRMIYRFNQKGEQEIEFNGKNEGGVLHGFIVPGHMFDIAVNQENELWIVNPGMHALEHYSYDGRLRGYWKHPGVNIEGFSGCCNPGHITFLNDGRFVTSEKGLVRIKTYQPSGDLDGVVAPPVKFTDNGQAPDLAADSRNHIYALDYDTKMIRVFVPLELTGGLK